MRAAAAKAAAVAALLGAWALAAFAAGPAAMATPLSTARALVTALGSGQVWTSVGTTMESAGGGLLIAAALAIPLGLLTGRSKRARDATVVAFEFLKPIPPVVVLPIVLLLLGTRISMQFVLIAFGAVWPMLMQTAAGARAVDKTTLETCSVYQIRRSRTLARVIVPATAPFIFRGVRLSASITLITAVTIELVGSAAGIGYLLIQSEAVGQLPLTYALVIITGTLGAAVNAVFMMTERRLTRWRPALR